MIRGILEGCVLSIIAEGETYGYEIMNRLTEEGFRDVLEGTLYPVLSRLEKKGLIHCRRAKSPFGPVRKYYTVTEEGGAYLKDFKDNYRQITKSAERILWNGGSYEK